MDRKGQIDKILATPIVLVIIIIIIAIFFAITFGIKLVKQPERPVLEASFTDTSLLLEEINIGEERYLVIEGLLLYDSEKISRELLEQGLLEILDEENVCLGLAKAYSPGPRGRTGGDALDDFFIKSINGEVNSLHLGARPLAFADDFYDLKTQEIALTTSKGTIYVNYYLGECAK